MTLKTIFQYKKTIKIIIGLVTMLFVILPVITFESLKVEDSIECRAIGFGGMMGDGYMRYMFLTRTCPTLIVKMYAKSSNLVAKVYAAKLLCKRGKDRCLGYFKKYAQNEEKVSFSCGCTTSAERISDLLYWVRRIDFEMLKIDSLEIEMLIETDKTLSEMDVYRDEYLNN